MQALRFMATIILSRCQMLLGSYLKLLDGLSENVASCNNQISLVVGLRFLNSKHLYCRTPVNH